MLIEKLTTQDIEELATLAQKTYRQTFSHSMTIKEIDDIILSTKSVDAFKQFLKDGDDFFVAKKARKIIGYIGMQKPNFKMSGRNPTSKDQALKGIYVDKKYHHQGIGRQLMDYAFDQPRFKQAENVYLCVWEENKPAYNFYLNYGFKKVGTYDVIANGKVIGTDQVMMKANS